jgi:hypothetical protein
MRRLLPLLAIVLALPAASALARRSHRPPRQHDIAFEPRTLDGSDNNVAHPTWGKAGTPYARIAQPDYAFGKTAPNARYISNRIFNDLGQNIFSERGVSQWVWTWGQFLDHTFGLAQAGTQKQPIATSKTDPLERFRNDLGTIAFTADRRAGGEQINTVDSYIDAWAVYGGDAKRLAWLKAPDGAHMLAPGGYLPKASDKPAPPHMDIDGRLQSHPQDAVEAGDVRANENLALTAVQTLLVREHNRIVDELPDRMPADEKFQIARRVVGAEEQYITYNGFLPAVGVHLPPYRGYDPSVNPSLTGEFATVGYRVHSMIHGEFEIGDKTIELNDAFFNPALLPKLGEGAVLKGLAEESQYKNDEQIDNALRSTLFEIPGPRLQGVVDLGAIDVQRGRDHGIPPYNALRKALGLKPKRSFTAVTGERTETMRRSIDDPHILDFTDLRDALGKRVAPHTDEADEDVRRATRRTTLAARLKAIYGSPDKMDAFVGMMSEKHVRGTEFGELQLAMWQRQFAALRDGDRFFYANDPVLDQIRRRLGIDIRETLTELIERNSDAGVMPANAFFAPVPGLDTCKSTTSEPARSTAPTGAAGSSRPETGSRPGCAATRTTRTRAARSAPRSTTTSTTRARPIVSSTRSVASVARGAASSSASTGTRPSASSPSSSSAPSTSTAPRRSGRSRGPADSATSRASEGERERGSGTPSERPPTTRTSAPPPAPPGPRTSRRGTRTPTPRSSRSRRR